MSSIYLHLYSKKISYLRLNSQKGPYLLCTTITNKLYQPFPILFQHIPLFIQFQGDIFPCTLKMVILIPMALNPHVINICVCIFSKRVIFALMLSQKSHISSLLYFLIYWLFSSNYRVIFFLVVRMVILSPIVLQKDKYNLFVRVQTQI